MLWAPPIQSSPLAVRMPGGVFAGSGAANINRDTWADLGTEQREFLLRAAARNVAQVTIRYNDAAREALDASREKGIEIFEPTPEMLDASAAFVDGDVNVIAKQFSDTYGLQNVDTKMATIRELVGKWKKLGDGLEQDVDGFAEVHDFLTTACPDAG